MTAQGVEIFVYGVGGGRFPARQHLDASQGDRAPPPARSRAHPLHPPVGHRDSGRRLSQRCRRGRERARAVHPRNGVRRSRGRACRNPRRLSRGRDRRGARERGHPARRDQILSVQRPARQPARRAAWGWCCRPRRRRSPRCGTGWRRMSRATARSAACCRSTSASRWRTAAVRRACACASSPIPPRSIRASWPTTQSSTGLPRWSRAHWPEAIAPGDLASAALASDVRSARAALLAALDLSELT